MSYPRIVFVAIVRNEGKIIERCLDAARPILDAIAICDTGSTDDTIDKIQGKIKEFNIPGEVSTEPWKNFGHNRTVSYLNAVKFITGLGWDLSKTYSLLIDADMVVEPNNFQKSELSKDIYTVEQYNESLSWFNIRFLRMSKHFKCYGVTHEHWGLDRGAYATSKDPKGQREPCDELRLKTLRIYDRGDGGCKHDKFERDIRLLTEGLQEDPNSERYTFYLAQSYRCCGRHDESIPWYEKRITMGGYFDEIWYSRLSLGEIYEAKKDWNMALKWYLDAYNYNPFRAEPIYRIAKYYRENNKQELGYMYANIGVRIPYPTRSTLFIDHPIYTHKMWVEIAICAYYTKHFRDDGFSACDRLLLQADIPDGIKNHIRGCIVHYITKLDTTVETPQVSLPWITRGKYAGLRTWYGLNPSIINESDGYTLIYRTVNYDFIIDKNYYDVMDSERIVRTRNYLVKLDSNFSVTLSIEIENPKLEFPGYIEGMEDCRLFKHQDRYWFTCTNLETTSNHVPRICLGRLSDYVNDKGNLEVDRFFPLTAPDTGCQKNWMPYSFTHPETKTSEIRIIYKHHPYTILKVDPETGNLSPIVIMNLSDISGLDVKSFRGSGGPIKYNSGYLYCVHEVFFQANNRRHYYHRLVWINSKNQIENISRPFIFETPGIEFCSGLSWSIDGKELLFGCGIKDRVARIFKFPRCNLHQIMNPIKYLDSL